MKTLLTLKQISLIALITIVASCASNKTSHTPIETVDTTTDTSSASANDSYNDVTEVEIPTTVVEVNKALEIPTASTTYYFSFDRSVLTNAAKEALRQQAAYLKDSKTNAIIEGHADERGSREYNIALGEQRAKSVKSFLVSEGVRSNQLEVVSYGEEKPLNRENSQLAWSTNRRAVLQYR